MDDGKMQPLPQGYGKGGNVFLFNLKQTLKPDCNGTARIKPGSKTVTIIIFKEDVVVNASESGFASMKSLIG